ncbi:MAG: TCR/Tet family MFS transporter [Methanobacteriota archaeon]|nr:MAG: TCR/Tet family MFS transporter [Euryarchaeota archaeon]
MRRPLVRWSSASRGGLGGRKAAMTFIYVTIVLDTLAFGILIPVLAPLVVSFTSSEAEGALMFGLLLTVWSLMQFLFSPLLGALSDRFGRRPVLILSAIGLGLDYIVMALAPNLAWLFVGRVFSGITAASYPTAAAYVADVTPPERRAAAFGMIGAAWGVGFILGPAFGGVLGGVGARLPFWAAAGMSLASAGYGFFVLPESLPALVRKKFTWRRANPIGSLTLLRSHRGLLGLASSTFLSFLAFQVLPSVFVIYAGSRYQWHEIQVGLTLTIVGVCNIAVQGVLVKRVIKRVGERRTLYTGLLGGMAGFLVYGLAPFGWVFLLGIPVFALIGLSQPALQSLMSRRVTPSEQGQLQGANASILGLTGILGPILFGWVLSQSLGLTAGVDLRGAPFLLAAVIMLASAAVAARVTRAETPASAPGVPSPVPDGADPREPRPTESPGDPMEEPSRYG